ncbi:MAG: circularly permuted type 2 ATP-grasp protein [Phenylobacterium sp.]|uniref:circularly permuted type 2 ATP-grasp protein n=1 Tax=Phenylobacterium sp. TaxID=1871053 RepID=UPI001A39B902|nr:circularly permuted type 2 ATP-grasp protein [Phenylobacterium sp.]MBL8773391.1 circularly permuted type 2 ATP-grasp protein [Phenylobacterium sp.]
MADDTSTADRRRGRERLDAWLAGYRPLPGAPDELIGADGKPRDHWMGFLSEFAGYASDSDGRFGMAARHIRDSGASYRIYGEETERSWPLDPLPLILGQAEWDQIAEGVMQRANLMEAVLQDLYGEARLVSDGVLPAAVVTGSPDFLRAMRGARPPGGRYLQVYAADLGRGPDGRWWVLEDRAQAPSGAGYALENRLVVSRAYPNLYTSLNVHRLAPFFDALRRGLAASAEREDPRICLLTPGPFSQTYFEQAHLARYLGFLLVEGDDLVARDGKVWVRTIAGLKRADVILRRVDSDFLDPLELNAASRLGVPGMLEAIRAGGVTVLNMPGSGLVESRALMGFSASLAHRLLGEELKLPNVATWWCGQPQEQALVEAELEHMAIAPAFPGYGGFLSGPRLVADLTAEEKSELRARLRDRPGDFVGQEVAQLSTMPVLRNGRLEPAPFVLRVFCAATPEGLRVMPGGFCRTSEGADVRAIFMGEGARTTDVWVVDDKPVERMTLIQAGDDVRVRRILGHLPSRAADNLFWLGRYLERTEATVRMVRALCSSVMDSESSLHGRGQTFAALRDILADWGALSAGAGVALDAARRALHDQAAWGSVINLVRSAKRTASGMRERLSADFWGLLVDLEADLAGGGGSITNEAQALEQVENALRHLAGLSGLAQENMNRVAGWRFLDMGRRIERATNTCQFVRTLAHDDASIDDLDLLLDLNDSQITYRARYIIGLALNPVRDLVMLDPFNTRSVAFQVAALKEHIAVLPTLREDGIPEPPSRILLPLAAELETEDAHALSGANVRRYEETLMSLSNAIADRFFLQGANAVPTVKLVGLA